MKQYIHVTKEVRQKLMKIFDVSSVMLWKALAFESDSPLARKIRKAALENLGILMNELPADQTIFDNDDYMRQYLPNGAMLEIGKTPATKGCSVYFKGTEVKHYNDVMVTEIKNIQDWAMSLK